MNRRLRAAGRRGRRQGRGGGKVAAAQAAVRSLQSAHPVLRAHIRAASTSSPTLAFPSPAPQLALALQPSALDFDSLLERELNSNPWAAENGPDGAPVLFAALYELPRPAGGAVLFVRIHTAACDRAASAALLKELLAHLRFTEAWGVANRLDLVRPIIE